MQLALFPKKDNQPNTMVGEKKRRGFSFLKKHRKKAIAAFLLLGVMAMAIYSYGTREQGVLVSTEEVGLSKFEKSVFSSGKLEVKDKQEVYAEYSTTIAEVLVEPGQKVEKGQTILRFDDRSLALEVAQNRLACEELRARILSSESNIRMLQQAQDSAEKDFANSKILYEEGAISQKEMEESRGRFNDAKEKLLVEQEANLPLLKAQLEQAEIVYQESLTKLEKSKVVSSIDGVVLNLGVKKGQRVEAGMLLAQIGDPTKLQIETGINEIDAAQLKVGDPVEIYNNSLLKEPLSGSVEYISPIAEMVATSQGEQSQVKIRIAVDNSEVMDQIKPGYNVNFKVILNQKDEAIVIPLDAIVEKDGKEYVYVVGQEGIVSEKEVQTGLTNELFTEIVKGLSVGERIILSPGEEIADGVKVIDNAAGE